MNNLGRFAAIAAFASAIVPSAQASILSASGSGGSEIILTVVNATTSASVSQDLGDQRAGLAGGDSFALSQPVLDLISGAGGLAGVTFAVIGGGAPNGTGAGSYIHSSAANNFQTTTIANSTKGTWLSNLGNLVSNLNGSNPGDTDSSVNAAYGPFASGGSPNYTGGNHNRWGTAASNLNNLGAGNADLFVYTVNFGSGFTGNAAVAELVAGGAKAILNVAQGQLQIQAVPAPAAVWLLGSGVALLVARRRLSQRGQAS